MKFENKLTKTQMKFENKLTKTQMKFENKLTKTQMKFKNKSAIPLMSTDAHLPSFLLYKLEYNRLQ